MALQFISTTPLEIKENRIRVEHLLGIPEQYELVAIFRMGYKDSSASRKHDRLDKQSTQGR